MDLPNRIAKTRVSAGLEINQKHQFLRGGALACRGNCLAAGRIHRDRLSQINMLARVHGGGSVFRVEIGRSLYHHSVELPLEQPLVGR